MILHYALRNMHEIFLFCILLCLRTEIFYQYISGLLHWHSVSVVISTLSWKKLGTWVRMFFWVTSMTLNKCHHYNDVIMGTIASKITSLTIVYSTVYSDADQRKHQSSASLAFVRGIHREPMKSPHRGPVICFHLMTSSFVLWIFRRTSKKTSKFRVTGLCAGNSLGTGEFPTQMASNAENVSIWWRHHWNGYKWFITILMPQSHHTPGPCTGCSRAVPGLFWTKIVRPLTGPAWGPCGAVRILLPRTGPVEF